MFKPDSPNWMKWMRLTLILVGLACLYAGLMKPEVGGFLYDDGMYLMVAQALAEGHGYSLPGIAGEPDFYKYPPLYPALLAGLIQITPAFPENISWLKSVNIGLTLASLGALFNYTHRQRGLPVWISLGLVLWLGTNGHVAEVGTELMSEPLFLLLSLLIVTTTERCFQATTPAKRGRLGWLILLSVAAFYCRTIGLFLILAVGIWLYLRQHKRDTLIYWGTCLILIAPWFWWSIQKPDATFAIGDFLVRSFQESYFQSFRMDLRYEYSLPELYWSGFQTLTSQFSTYFFPLLDRLSLGAIHPLAQTLVSALSLLMIGILGYRAYSCGKNRILPTLPALYVGLYMAALPFWSFHNCYPRFFAVILPWLMLPLTHTLLSAKWPGRIASCLVGGLLLTGIITNSLHLMPLLQKQEPNQLMVGVPNRLWDDYQQTFAYLKAHTPPDSVIYSDNGDESYFYGLNSSRKTVDSFLFLPSATISQHCPDLTEACLLQQFAKNAQATEALLRRSKASYYIHNRFQVIKSAANSGYPVIKRNPAAQRLLQQYPDEFTRVHQTAAGWITVYRFTPKPPAI